MKILIAEDDPVSCRVLEVLLKKWGYEVVIAKNGGEAWQRLQGENAPKRASKPLTASVTEDRGKPRSSAALVKLRRSTMRVKTRMASKRSIVRSFEL